MTSLESLEAAPEEIEAKISNFLERRLAAVALDNMDDPESSFSDAGAYDLMTAA